MTLGPYLQGKVEQYRAEAADKLDKAVGHEMAANRLRLEAAQATKIAEYIESGSVSITASKADEHER